MLQPKDSYKNYLSHHNEFSEEHRVLNKEIIEMYVLPKIFIEENEKAIRQFTQNFHQHDVPGRVELSFRGVRDFLYEIEDFKLQTIELFFEHKAYIDCCSEYVKGVSKLKQSCPETVSADGNDNYTELIPRLTDLRSQLKKLHQRALTMTVRLEKIEARWTSIHKSR